MRATTPRQLAALVCAALTLAAAALVAMTALRPVAAADGASLGQLNSALGATQAQQRSLQSSLDRLQGVINELNAQVDGVRAREASVQTALDNERGKLVATRDDLTTEKTRYETLLAELSHARTLLAAQLVSQYERPAPNLMTIVLSANGFGSLLDTLTYLRDVERRQQHIITFTRQAKAEAHAAEVRLTALEHTENQITTETAQRVAALQGMNQLLSSRQAALASAQDAQQSALAASRARGAQLQKDISHVKAQQAAAERAAAIANGTPTALSPALGPSGGWSIPYPIVLCESGGQNLTPNSAGASGYYQIIPSTWALFNGSGPAAYLASKAEQDAVATRIWNGGAGAGNWVCAHILGYVH